MHACVTRYLSTGPGYVSPDAMHVTSICMYSGCNIHTYVHMYVWYVCTLYVTAMCIGTQTQHTHALYNHQLYTVSSLVVHMTIPVWMGFTVFFNIVDAPCMNYVHYSDVNSWTQPRLHLVAIVTLHIYIYVYIYIYIYIYTYMYICMQTYICTYVCVGDVS